MVDRAMAAAFSEASLNSRDFKGSKKPKRPSLKKVSRKISKSLQDKDQSRGNKENTGRNNEANLVSRDRRLKSLDPIWEPSQLEKELIDKKLFECVFVAGLYYDAEAGKHVAFTRETFPENFPLPTGIEELCFPDADFWQPHRQETTGIYTVVLTDPSGDRRWAYCKRIRPEGDTLCSPLAIGIITECKDRETYASVLNLLTKVYGSADCNIKDFLCDLNRRSLKSLSYKRKISYVQTPKSIISTQFSVDDLLLLYTALLTEKSLVVLGNNLSDLSLFFEELEMLLNPFRWPHLIIPTLPASRLGFLDAPTPFIIGLLKPVHVYGANETDGDNEEDENLDQWWKWTLKPLIDDDKDYMVLAVQRKKDKVKLRLIVKPKEEILMSYNVRKAIKKNTKGAGKDEFLIRFTTTLQQEFVDKVFSNSNIGHFVTFDRKRERRVFKVHEFIDQYNNSDVHDFLYEFAHSAVFAEFIRDQVTKLDIGLAKKSLKADELGPDSPAFLRALSVNNEASLQNASEISTTDSEDDSSDYKEFGTKSSKNALLSSNADLACNSGFVKADDASSNEVEKADENNDNQEVFLKEPPKPSLRDELTQVCISGKKQESREKVQSPEGREEEDQEVRPEESIGPSDHPKEEKLVMRENEII